MKEADVLKNPLEKGFRRINYATSALLLTPAIIAVMGHENIAHICWGVIDLVGPMRLNGELVRIRYLVPMSRNLNTTLTSKEKETHPGIAILEIFETQHRRIDIQFGLSGPDQYRVARIIELTLGVNYGNLTREQLDSFQTPSWLSTESRVYMHMRDITVSDRTLDNLGNPLQGESPDPFVRYLAKLIPDDEKYNILSWVLSIDPGSVLPFEIETGEDKRPQRVWQDQQEKVMILAQNLSEQMQKLEFIQ